MWQLIDHIDLYPFELHLLLMYVFITHSDLVHHQQFELVTVGISASVIN